MLGRCRGGRRGAREGRAEEREREREGEPQGSRGAGFVKEKERGRKAMAMSAKP